MVNDVPWAVKGRKEKLKKMGLRMSTQGLSTLTVLFYLFERRGSEANVV